MNIKMGPLKKMIRKDPKNWREAEKVGGIQFQTWMNTGTGVSSRKPPIRFGVLRGSSSVFVANELVEIFKQNIDPGATENPTPLTAYNGSINVITWVYNTDYAKRMHEWKGKWGKFTKQDGDAGNKWMINHLKADKDKLFEVIILEHKKLSGM